MSFFNEPAFDETKTNSIENTLGTAKFAYTSNSFRNNGIMLQKYYYYASIMPDAPDIVLCSKICWHQ